MSKIIVRRQEYANNGTHANEIEAVVKQNLIANTLSSATDIAPSVGLLKSVQDGTNESIRAMDWYRLLSYEVVTTAQVNKTLMNERKFSDYDLISAQIVDNNLDYFKSAIVIPKDLFKEHPMSMTFVNSANQQFWIDVHYVDDTTVKVQASASANNYRICIQGIKLKSALS